MLLCEDDIKRLEKAGYTKERFARFDKQGYAKLRNTRGYCFFYKTETHRCSAYELRPLGCRIYPVIYGEEDAIIVDDLCPQKRTVSDKEMAGKGKKVTRLLAKIDLEAKSRNSGRN
jgi:Fe-S-cluster containining protein